MTSFISHKMFIKDKHPASASDKTISKIVIPFRG